MNLARFLVLLQRTGAGWGINQLAVLIAVYQAARPVDSLHLAAATGITETRDITRILHRLATTGFVKITPIPNARQKHSCRYLYSLTPQALKALKKARHTATA